VAVLGVIGAGPAGRAATDAPEFVLQPEGNHLWAYDVRTGAHQLVARAQNGIDPGEAAPNGMVRDINGQICVSPDGRHVVTGEDTVVATGGGDGASSHDPRIAGWGWFAIDGDHLGAITIEQQGKLAPEAGTGPGYTGDPDNFGCGFLDPGRLVTTAIGNTLPGEPANGQLFLWFGPFDRGFREEVDGGSGAGFYVGEVDHCEIDHTLATAGGIAVAPSGDVYVAANRPSDLPVGDPAAIWRYSGQWPSSMAECTPEFLAAHITRTAVIPNLPLPLDPHAATPSAVVLSPAGTLYVSSVFTGTVAEFSLDGTWIRDLYPTSPVAVPTGPTGETPFGLAVTSDGSLWISDLGVVGDGPGDGLGSLERLRFAGGSPAGPAETVRDGLAFPDGLGVYRPPPAAAAAAAAPVAGRGPTLPATGGSDDLVVAALASAVIALAALRRVVSA
jgi:hypothetical protein